MFDYPEMTRVELRGFSSEFGCKRFYVTSPPVYYMIEIWRILGPAPITVNPSHPTIPHNGLRGSVEERKKNIPIPGRTTDQGRAMAASFLL